MRKTKRKKRGGVIYHNPMVKGSLKEWIESKKKPKAKPKTKKRHTAKKANRMPPPPTRLFAIGSWKTPQERRLLRAAYEARRAARRRAGPDRIERREQLREDAAAAREEAQGDPRYEGYRTKATFTGGRRRKTKRKKRGSGRNDPFYVPDPIHEKQEKKNWELFYACAFQDFPNILKALDSGADPNWVFTYEKASRVARGIISKGIRKAGDLMRAGRDPFRGRIGQPWGLEPGLFPSNLDTLQLVAMNNLNLPAGIHVPVGERMHWATDNDEPYLKKINKQISLLERIQINASGRRHKFWWVVVGAGLPHGEGDGGYINLNWKAQVFEGDTSLLVLMRSFMLGAYPYGVYPFMLAPGNVWRAEPPYYYQRVGRNLPSFAGCLTELLKAGATGVKENVRGESICNNQQMMGRIYEEMALYPEERSKMRRSICRVGEIEATLKGPKRGRKFNVGMGFDLKEDFGAGPKETVFRNLSPEIGKYLGGRRRKTRRRRTRRKCAGRRRTRRRRRRKKRRKSR